MGATPRSVPIQGGRKIWRYVLSGVGLAALVLAYFTVPQWWDKRARTKWKAAVHAREDKLAEFGRWLDVGTCIRRESGARWLDAVTLVLPERLHEVTDEDPLADPACRTELERLANDPVLTEAARAALRDWQAADVALHPAEHPASGVPLLARPAIVDAISARDRILERVRRDVLAPIREDIRAVQTQHAAARDYIWWRLELGFGLEDLLDRAYAARASHAGVAAAIAAPFAKLKQQIADAEAAYVGIARVPELDELARAKPEVLWDVVRRVPDNGEWSELAHDNMVYGPMPPEPEGCNVSDEEQ